MANKEIYQFSLNNNIQSSDLVPFSNETIPGHISSVSTFSNFVSKVKLQIGNSSSNIYVSPSFGSDLNGNGTYLNPYATIDFAISQITPSITNPVNLVLTSEIYSVENLIFKPFVYFVGNNSKINILNSISISADWGIDYGDTLNFYCSKCSFICSNDITLDFSTLTQNQNHFLSFDDVFFSSNFSIIGNSKQFINFSQFSNNFLNSTFSNISLFDFYNSEFSNLYINNTTNIFGIIGNIYSCSILGELYLSSSSTNHLNVSLKSSNISTSIKIDGENCILKSDCNINLVPTLLNDGIWIPESIASGVIVQSPVVNFEHDNNNVDSYFKGIDNRFGEISYSEKINTFFSLSLSNPPPYYISVDMLSSNQSIKLPLVNDGSKPLISVGQKIYFETLSSSNTFNLQYHDGSLIVDVSPNSCFYMILDNNSTPNGVWQRQFVVQSVNGEYGEASLTGLNVPAEYTPTNYTPGSIYVAGHLEGINQALVTGPTPGTSSYAEMIFNLDGPSTAGAISFANNTTYLPPLVLTANACYFSGLNFTLQNDGYSHAILVCKDTTGGVYNITTKNYWVTINSINQQNYMLNYAINGFSLANVNQAKDEPFSTFGQLDKDMKPGVFISQLSLNYNDILYPIVLRSADTSPDPYDNFMKQRYLFVRIDKIANSNADFLPYNIVSGNSQNLISNNRYLCTASGLTNLTLPLNCGVGDVIIIHNEGFGTFRILQNSGQIIAFASLETTAGSGYIESEGSNQSISLTCVQANTKFLVGSSVGNFFIT